MASIKKVVNKIAIQISDTSKTFDKFYAEFSPRNEDIVAVKQLRVKTHLIAKKIARFLKVDQSPCLVTAYGKGSNSEVLLLDHLENIDYCDNYIENVY